MNKNELIDMLIRIENKIDNMVCHDLCNERQKNCKIAQEIKKSLAIYTGITTLIVTFLTFFSKAS